MSKQTTGISPRRDENYGEWYHSVLKAAELSDQAPVRGCIVIRPWGYSLWENIKEVLDKRLKETGHQNAYFPLFIPLSFMQREAEHVEGFAKECALVTHCRLEKDKEGNLVTAGRLEEPLLVRPTSEMLIGESFSRWVNSYRDLPLLINQWANVVRWEMRPRPFLRTTEFLWQEGHTVHATSKEAVHEAITILDIYEELVQETLAIPVIKGKKSDSERFPGAVDTYTIEAMMQDCRAVQMGTSHFLGQNFARASNIRFRDQDGSHQYPWTTSWGATTRLIGALVMTHSDDDGLVLPPKIAPIQLVIIPVMHDLSFREELLRYCDRLAVELRNLDYNGKKLQILVDEREERGGEKVWHWIKKGVPIRLEIGRREMESEIIPLYRRDRSRKEAFRFSREKLVQEVVSLLQEIQDSLYQKALNFRDRHMKKIDNKEELFNFFNREGEGGFALAHWSEDAAAELDLKEQLGITIRCIPLDQEKEVGRCVMSGKLTPYRVIYAKAY